MQPDRIAISKHPLITSIAATVFVAGHTHACELSLRLIGTYSIPAETRIEGDVFGGISGIDYDRESGQWFMVSDDRPEHGPPRFFIGELRFDSKRIGAVGLRASRHFQPLAYDPEAIRIAHEAGYMLVAGEGDAARGLGPWLNQVSLTGKLLGKLPLPSLFETTEQTGPRPNRSLEGLSYAPDGETLWLALETPLLQDGTVADSQQTSDVRVTHMTFAGKVLSQFVYRTDTASAHKIGESSDNGISEILSLNATDMLVLERSGIKAADGSLSFNTRLYCASFAQATDVAGRDSLLQQPYQVAKKRLLLNFASLSVPVTNLEGMSWGPPLGGERSLVFASDNNFVAGVPTQLLFFSVH